MEYSATSVHPLEAYEKVSGFAERELSISVRPAPVLATARTMLANSEFLIMLNQAATDREELAHLLNISDNQLSYITNVDSGRGLIKCGSAIVPFVDHFPKNKLYRLMTTKPSDLAA